MPEKVQKQPLFNSNYTVLDVKELNFFDLDGSKASTKGTSNKTYHAEIQLENNGTRCQIYTIWGATGAANQTKEWRHYNSQYSAEKDFAAIIKSKVAKGYRVIDVAQRAQGSDIAKAIIKPVALKNAEPVNLIQSKYHPEVQRLVSELFNITNNWVITTLKCPLGQLTNNQIDIGRNILKTAQEVLDKNSSSDSELLKLTNDFYAEIPHNLGQGSRGQLSNLLLNTKEKIAQKNEDLDLLLDAKAAGASLSTSSSVEEKYKTLNAEFDYLDNQDPIFKWVEKMVHDTRAHNHSGLGKIKVHNVFKLNRHGEKDLFIKNSQIIAKDKPNTFTPAVIEKLAWNRPDLDKDLLEFYRSANILPVWHGTRRANVVGITMKGFLIRPSGVVLAGSMYGDGVYYATSSTKSINYTDCRGSYWANGSADRAFLFLCDVAFGKPKIASGSYMYNLNNIKGYHSVWAQAGKSGVINDELIVYNPSGPNQQHMIKYIVEFESKS